MFRRVRSLITVGLAAVLVLVAPPITHAGASDSRHSLVNEIGSSGESPGAILYEDVRDLIYVADHGAGTVTVFNPSDYSIVKRIELTSNHFNGTEPVALTSDPDKGDVYVINRGLNSVYVKWWKISASNDFELQEFGRNVGWRRQSSIAFNPRTQLLYVTRAVNMNVDDVLVFSLKKGLLVDRIEVGKRAEDVIVDQETGLIYVANAGDGTVSIIEPSIVNIDTTRHEVVATIPVGLWPVSLALHDDRLYVANEGSNTVSAINTTTRAVDGEDIAVGTAPRALAVDPRTGVLYVANRESKNVSIVNGTHVEPVDVIAAPEDIAVNSRTGRAYVTYTNPRGHGMFGVIAPAGG